MKFDLFTKIKKNKVLYILLIIFLFISILLFTILYKNNGNSQYNSTTAHEQHFSDSITFE